MADQDDSIQELAATRVGDLAGRAVALPTS
jgi:hypothetical protein